MMDRSRSPWLRLLVLLAVPLLAMGALAGCSEDDDDGDDSSDTTEASTDTTASGESNAEVIAFDKEIQTELEEVGCYSGGIDGIIGPETDAAIVAFQTAKGLEVDGELGPETEDALKAAVDAGETDVCSADTTTTTAEGGSTTTSGGGGGTAPCTAAAIQAALPSGTTMTSYVCSEGWAAGSDTEGDGSADGAFILQDVNGTWQEPAQDPCDSASAGLPEVILQDGCVS
jgi:hypothetical protein